MAKKNINIGQSVNDKTGDTLRSAFDKINQNFTELYNATGGGLDLLNVASNIVPDTDNTRTLGTPTKRWGHLYVGPGSISIGDAELTLEGGKIKSSTGFKLTDSQLDDVLPSQTGNAGKFLTTDGTHTLSWAVASGGTTDYNNLTNKPTIPTSFSSLVNGSHTVSLSSVGLTAFPAISNESLFIQASELGSANASVGISAKDNVIVTANILSTAKQWIFGTDGTLTLPPTPTGITNANQIVATRIYRATTSNDVTAIINAKTDWIGSETQWEDARNNDAITYPSRSWAGLPSWEAYPLVLAYNGPNQPSGPFAQIVTAARNQYLTFKGLESNIDIVSGNKVFSFENTGNITVPGGLNLSGNIKFADDTVQTTAWTNSISWTNVTSKPTIPTSFSSLVNSTKTVSLGTNGTLTLPAPLAQLTDANQLANDTAKIYRATNSTDAEAIQSAWNTWYGHEQLFKLYVTEDESGRGSNFPWHGMPSWEAYPLIMNWNSQGGPGLPLNPSMAPAAKTAQDSYLAYKQLVSSIDIVNGNKTISFNNAGLLSLPGKLEFKDTANAKIILKTIDPYGYVVEDSEQDKTWTFNANGSLTLPLGNSSIIGNSSIQSVVESGYQSAITLNPYRILSQTVEPGNRSYYSNDGDYVSATWTNTGFGGSTIAFTTPEQYVLDFINTDLPRENNVTVRINGAGAEYPYSYSNGTNEIYLSGAPTSLTAVTEIRFSYQRISKIHIEPDDGVFDIVSRAGTTIDIDAGFDLRMTAYDDVEITAGDQLQLRSGDNYASITTNHNVPNATPQVWTFNTDGTTQFPDDTINAGTNEIYIQSSNTVALSYTALDGNWESQPNQNQIAGLAASPYGVNITLGRTNDGVEGPTWSHEWLFDKDGVFTLPEGGTISEGGGLTGAIKLKPAGGANDYQALLIYPTAGADGDHIHLTAGGGTTELYLGSDNHYVKLASGGVVRIQADNGVNSSAAWTFGTNGALTTTDPLTLTVPGVPNGVANWNGQGGWNSPPYTNKATTGGTGTGLTVNVSTATGGYIDINAITINTAGTGYTNGDIITITNENNLPGTFTITVPSNNWTFGANGNTTFPTGLRLSAARGSGTVNFTSDIDKVFQIETQTASTGKLWNFGTDGWLTLPNNGVVQANTLVALSSFNDTNNIARVICQSVLNTPQVNLKTITSTGEQKDWVFSSTGALTLPNSTVIRQSTNAEVTAAQTAYTAAIASWEYTRINDYLYSINNNPGLSLAGWPFAGWSDVSGTTASAYLAIVDNAQTIQNSAPSSPPTPLVFTPALSFSLYTQIRAGLQSVINTYAAWQALLTSVDIVAGSETLSLLSNNKIQMPGIIQTDVEEDITIRTRFAVASSPPGTTVNANTDFVFGTNGTLTFTGTNSYNSIIQGDASGNLNLTAGNYVNIEADSYAAITLAKYVANTSVDMGNATSPVRAFGDLWIMSGRNITTDNTTISIVNTNATTVNFAGAATTLNIGAAGGTTTIAGNLTINGTTTTVNSTTLTVDDKNIELGSVATPTDTTADGGGITLKGATDKTFNWVNATGAWTSSEDLNLLTGKVYEINGVAVLSASALLNDASQTSVTIAGSATTALNIGASGAPITGFARTATTSSTAESLGYLGMPQNAKSVNANTVIGDQGKHIYITGPTTITIDGSLAYPIGTTITFINSTSTATIAITTNTMALAGVGTTGSRTLAPYGMATAIKVTSTLWYINGTGLT